MEGMDGQRTPADRVLNGRPSPRTARKLRDMGTTPRPRQATLLIEFMTSGPVPVPAVYCRSMFWRNGLVGNW